jgi:hypothetical protein
MIVQKATENVKRTTMFDLLFTSKKHSHTFQYAKDAENLCRETLFCRETFCCKENFLTLSNNKLQKNHKNTEEDILFKLYQLFLYQQK